MTALQALIAGVIAGAFAVGGVAGLAGPFWAMLAAAAWITVGIVLLYDPAKSGKRRKMVRRNGFRVDQ